MLPRELRQGSVAELFFLSRLCFCPQHGFFFFLQDRIPLGISGRPGTLCSPDGLHPSLCLSTSQMLGLLLCIATSLLHHSLLTLEFLECWADCERHHPRLPAFASSTSPSTCSASWDPGKPLTRSTETKTKATHPERSYNCLAFCYAIWGKE